MISVKLRSIKKLQEMISFAAKSCYEGEEPKIGDILDIKTTLFQPGHHTTLQHASTYFTFFIDGIAISDVTSGLHLANPFYNSSQRSGRFCGKMFSDPDFNQIESYIRKHWPLLKEISYLRIMRFIEHGIHIYQINIERAAELAKRFIKEERPLATDKYIYQNAPKFAQEQLRVFVSTIFPTALTYTINISALAAFYKVAWSPALKDVTQKMVDIVLEKEPSFGYMFSRRENTDGIFSLPKVNRAYRHEGVLTKPVSKLVSAGDPSRFIEPDPGDLHPLDILHFEPFYMDNNVEEVKSDVEVSLATFGQDQRHRTIRRSRPFFTGGFYLPPIPKELELNREAERLLDKWLDISWHDKDIPETLSHAIAPYGIMVGYRKSAPYNAFIHESLKRLCWCSQEEIFHLNLRLREQIAHQKGEKFPLLPFCSPTCVRTGKCGEGKRYCGRDREETCFIERKV